MFSACGKECSGIDEERSSKEERTCSDLTEAAIASDCDSRCALCEARVIDGNVTAIGCGDISICCEGVSGYVDATNNLWSHRHR